MNIDNFKSALRRTQPEPQDTERTLAWKLLLARAKESQQSGNWEDASACYEGAVSMIEARLGSKNIVLAHVLMQFSILKEEMEELAQSKEMSHRARMIIADLASDAEGELLKS